MKMTRKSNWISYVVSIYFFSWDENADGTIPIQYSRWCPFSPVEEHRLGGEHIISVVYPDNNIVDNFANRLREVGLTDDQIFFPEEVPDGTEGEPAEASE